MNDRRAPFPRSEERDAAPVLDALLGLGAEIMVPVRGMSMSPTLLDRDQVIVAPFLGPPRCGQLVMGRQDGRLVVHRLVRIEMRQGRRRYRLQGDARHRPDPGILREDLLGRVVALIRQGRRLEIDDQPAALRRKLRRLAIRRGWRRVARGAAVLLLTVLCALGWTSASQEGTYAPAPEYRFGPGDVLSLRIWNGQKLEELQLTIQSDGEAFLPMAGLGAMSMGGRTVIDVKEELTRHLAAIYNETFIELLMLKYAGHRVHLMGEVRNSARNDTGPGEWPLRGPTRLVEFLSAHGGPGQAADLMRIHLIRQSGERREVNLFRAVFHGSAEDNPLLASGDLVFVPSMAMGNRKVFILGEVRSPGVFNIMDKLGLVEAISRAGGITQKGYLKGVVVLKRGKDGPAEMRLANFKKMYKKGDMSADIPLQPGDVVFVPRRALATIQEVFSIINPALGIIESIYIIDNFRDD
jgi:polysaccharide export outer membrane protein